MGSLQLSETIEVQINGLFVMTLTVLITGAIFFLMFRSRWGRKVRAVVQNRVMAGAVGSHWYAGDPAATMLPPLVLLIALAGLAYARHAESVAMPLMNASRPERRHWS